MKFSVQPPLVVESLIGTIVVDLENPTSSDDVTITIGTGSGVLSGTTTVAAVNGVAIFDDLEVDTAGSYTLVATAVLQQNGCANFSPFGSFQPGYYFNDPNAAAATTSVTSNPFTLPAPDTILLDNFDGVNGTALASHAPDINVGGNPWVDVAPGWKIQSNAATFNNGFGITSTIDIGVAEGTATLNFQFIDLAHIRQIAMNIGMGATSYISATFGSNGSFVLVIQDDSGDYFSEFDGHWMQDTSPHEVIVTHMDSIVQVFLDGVLLYTVQTPGTVSGTKLKLYGACDTENQKVVVTKVKFES